MKKTIACLISVVSVAPVVIWALITEWRGPSVPSDVFVIGVVRPKTGDSAKGGCSMKEGIDLAFEDIAGPHSGRSKSSLRIVLREADDRGNPADGIAAANKLIVEERASALIGVVNSSVALALRSVIDEHKLTLISAGASSPQLSGSSKFFFRTCPSDLEEARAIARFAFGEDISQIAILYVNNEYGLGLREPFRREFEALGGTIVAEDNFLPGTTTFQRQLKAIARSKPQAVYIVGDPKELGLCIREAKGAGGTWRFFSVSSFEEREAMESAADAAEGVVVASARFDPCATERSREFTARFRRRFHHEPESLAANGYDALTVLVRAVDKTNGNRGRIPEQLRSLRESPDADFQGVTGLIHFDEKGDVNRNVSLRIVEKGRLVRLNEARDVGSQSDPICHNL